MATQNDVCIPVPEEETDYSQRGQWLRAAVLGATDGLVSVASLMMGVGAVKQDVRVMILTGFAGLVAGACSMAIGEFVSVYSQRDVEVAQMKRDNKTEKDQALPNPIQAALASAVAFMLGAMMPLLAAAFIVNHKVRLGVVAATVSLGLVGFGWIGAVLGRIPVVKSCFRIVVGGWMAMGITFGLTKWIGSTGLRAVVNRLQSHVVILFAAVILAIVRVERSIEVCCGDFYLRSGKRSIGGSRGIAIDCAVCRGDFVSSRCPLQSYVDLALILRQVLYIFQRSVASSNRRTAIRFSDLKHRRYWLPLMIGIGLLVFQQLSGINGVLFYASNIFQSADFVEQRSSLYVAMSILSVVGVVGMVIGFSLGMGPIPWVIMSEVKYDGYLVEKYGDERSNHPKFDEVFIGNDLNAPGKQDPENQKLNEIIKEILKEKEKEKERLNGIIAELEAE
ncbi:hypothetical protein R6Q59_020681 [Mikania micrantha]